MNILPHTCLLNNNKKKEVYDIKNFITIIKIQIISTADLYQNTTESFLKGYLLKCYKQNDKEYNINAVEYRLFICVFFTLLKFIVLIKES